MPRIPAQFGLDPIRDIQVLCLMNRGRIGARALNLDFQASLNGDPSKPAVSRFGCSFRSGDKVMQTINDYDKDAFNGDLGFVHAVGPETQELVLDFDGRLVTMTSANSMRLSPPMRLLFSKRKALNIREW
jgi:exodeoxyribonuclease V alpha subunit